MTSTVAFALILTPAGDAYASTGNACSSNYTSTDFPNLDCINIVGSGLHVTTDTGWFKNTAGFTENKVHLELTGPKGHIANGPEINLAAGHNSPNTVWAPNANEPSGYYCTIVWANEGGGFYLEANEECVQVHT